jgi:pimeloyl-ACP methyl ester carboxylesterase
MLTSTTQSTKRWLYLLLLSIQTLWITGCTSTGQLVGTNSPIAALGAPSMVQTSLGRLAVWDTEPQSNEPPVVLWPSIFSDHVIYASLVEHWRGKRRLILIDGPGHGASEGPQDKTFSMQACADALKQVLDARSVQRAVVGGTSWGGLVGGEFAILYPEKTQGLIMMNTPFFTGPDGPSTAEKFITWGAGNILGTRLFTGGVARSFFLTATRESGGLVMTHFHDSLHRSDSKALSTAIRSVLIERIALADRLSQIKAPTLVIAGLKDEMYPIELQRQAVKQLSAGQFKTVDSQHISVVDQPAEVAVALDAFLNQLTSNTK